MAQGSVVPTGFRAAATTGCIRPMGTWSTCESLLARQGPSQHPRECEKCGPASLIFLDATAAVGGR